MVRVGTDICPECNWKLEYKDTVRRIVRTKGRETRRAYMRRLRCPNCGALHRELPDFVVPFKQYEKEVIQGVVEGLITSNTLGYEDYPCEDTMDIWRHSQNLHALL